MHMLRHPYLLGKFGIRLICHHQHLKRKVLSCLWVFMKEFSFQFAFSLHHCLTCRTSSFSQYFYAVFLHQDSNQNFLASKSPSETQSLTWIFSMYWIITQTKYNFMTFHGISQFILRNPACFVLHTIKLILIKRFTLK